MTTSRTLLTNDSILQTLGERVEQLRIRKNLTQAQLAREAGIGKRTLERLENGKTTQLSTFISVLRPLGLLDELLNIVPDPAISPMAQLLKEKSPRYRASGKRSKTNNKGTGSDWTWDD